MAVSWLKQLFQPQQVRQFKRVLIGKTQVAVTEMGLGTASIGNLYRKVSEKEAIQTIHRAFQLGIRLFDTAPLYGRTSSETRLGKALKDIPRGEYILSTKVGRLVTPTRITLDFSKDGVRRSLDGSLERLGVDRIDIVHLHDPDAHYRVALDQGFPALAALREQGVIGAVSAGMNQWQMLLDFAQNADFDCFMLAGRYTLLEQGALGFLEYCHQRGIGVLAAGVYNSGILGSEPRADAKFNYATVPGPVLEKANRLAVVCRGFNVSLRAAAVQFVRMHPAVSALVIGAESPRQISESVQAFGAVIPADFWAALKQIGLIDFSAPIET
jgi:D-threo-aldose 1-dehydrogenase